MSILDIPLFSISRGEVTCLRQLSNNKPMVIDIWHSNCRRCPSSLEKLSKMNIDGIIVACAFSQGEGNLAVVSEIVEESFPNLEHFFADEKEKEEIKKMFGIKSVPYCIILDKNGSIALHGDPSNLNIEAILAPKTDSSSLSFDEDF